MKSPYHGGDRPQEKIKHYCCPAAGAPETAVMYQHLSSFQPLDLKYDTFCEYAGWKEVDTWFIDTIGTEVEID